MTELLAPEDAAAAAASTPVGFDVDAWLEDSKLPEESTVVYKRADVVAELTNLKHLIDLEKSTAHERAAGETSNLAQLQAKYHQLLETFGDSALTIYVRAVTPDEKLELRKQNDAVTEKAKLDPTQSNRDYAARLLARAVVATKLPAAEERTPVTWAPETIKKLEDKLGTTQMTQVMAAYQTAQNAMPAVDADFLPRASGSSQTADS